MPKSPIFRRRYIVKKGLQFRYIGLIFMLALLASFITGWTVFATGWSFFGEKLASVYPQGRLIYVFKAINLALMRNLLLVSPLIFLLGLLFSHRIAGPLYRIEKTLIEITKGNLTLKIKLRQGDELTSLADIINTMTDNFNSVLVLNKEKVINAQKNLEEIKKMLSSQSYDHAKLESLVNETRLNIEKLMVYYNQ